MNINEDWVDLYGFEDQFEVSNLGRFRNKETKKLAKVNSKLLTVRINNNTYSARRLIYKSFNPNYDFKHVIYTKSSRINKLYLINIGAKDSDFYYEKTKREKELKLKNKLCRKK